MGFLKDLFKADREYEEELRKKTIENQVKIWEIQARMGETPNIQADMDKIYGLDKLEQRKQEKQQTKEIIKGAVTGGIIAGDAGAVVGAMVSKNKIDNRNNNSNARNTQYVNTPYTRQAQPMPSASQGANYTSSMRMENHSSNQNDEVPPAVKHHESGRWSAIKEQLLNDSCAKTGDIAKDVEYCISRLEVATVSDLSDIINQPIGKTRIALTPMMNASKVERFEYDGKPYFLWKKSHHSVETVKEGLSTATALNYYGSEVWKRTKSTLVENGFTKTGNLQTDILYCLSQLKIASLRDLMEIFDESVSVIRPELTPLMNNETVKRIEHEGKPMFAMANATFNDQTTIPTVPTNNINKFDEVKKFKELLDSGIITQEEFDAKKKQLLGL